MDATLGNPLLDHARHLAEGMWTPTLVLAKDGTILFCNEGAEILMGRRFVELGPMSAADYVEAFDIRSMDGSTFPLASMPGWLELLRSRPGNGHLRFVSLDGIERLVRVIGLPLFTQLGEFVGAIVHCWEGEDAPGASLNATVLFCDLRGHTADAGRLGPDRVKELLDVFYEHIARLINRHGGTVMSFVGDEIFAAWGAPTPDDDAPDKAVQCARLLQDAGDALNQKLGVRDLPAVAYGIGIHSGEVVDAHVGFGKLRQYTVTGDTVNCGSRLCSIAGRNEIVVSADTYELLSDKPPATKLEGIQFKGVKRDLLPHRLWPDELRDPTGEVRRPKT